MSSTDRTFAESEENQERFEQGALENLHPIQRSL